MRQRELRLHGDRATRLATTASPGMRAQPKTPCAVRAWMRDGYTER